MRPFKDLIDTSKYLKMFFLSFSNEWKSFLFLFFFPFYMQVWSQNSEKYMQGPAPPL